MPELSRVVAGATSRRGFIARLGGVLVAAAGGGSLLGPGARRADAHHICGHIGDTGACPHPTGMPRIDLGGRPLRASDGRPVDDLGRVVDRLGRPVDDAGLPLLDPSGRPLPSASRSRICLDGVPERYGLVVHQDGIWHRCCRGRVRRIVDCCSTSRRRVNGDASVVGYCRPGRRVFCIQYYETNVPC